MIFKRMAGVLAGGLVALGLSVSAHAAEWITLEGDGHSVRALEAGPADAQAAIVVVHDWFGVTYFTEIAVDRFVGLGYRVLMVDLYGGEEGTTHAEARALMQGLDEEVVAAQLDLALARVSAGGRTVGIMGFSMGAAYALDAAARAGDGVSAAVSWYGDTSLSEAQTATLTATVLAVYGSLDGNAAEQAATLSQTLDESGGAAEVYVYPGAGHAFAQVLFNEGQNFDEGATAAAWALTEDFFARRLGTSN